VSRLKDIRRQLDGAVAAVEELDAALRSGRLSAEEHARQRAEHERAAGRLFVTFRQAQREAREHDATGPGSVRRAASAGGAGGGPPRPAWFRGPVALASGAVLLVVVGVGAGVGVGRSLTGSSLAPATSSTPDGGHAGALTAVELQVLRQAAAREDAPIPVLLRFAHVELDEGRTGEARRVYERVLAREPRNVEAITHIGAVLFQEGRVDEALGKVDEALELDPRYLHALWDRTQYLYYAKRWPGAVQAGEAFLQVLPEGPDADNIRTLVADARQQASRAPSTPGR
jgi:tetratricopeptide (TPR) repeat protein